MPETYQRNEGPSSADILAQVNQFESRLLELANQLDSIRRLDNNPFSAQPPPFLTETVPLAQSVEIVSATQEVGTTHVAMRWVKPPRNDIERFEIWAKNVAFASEQPFKVTDATDAPATFSLTADSDTGVVLFVRTVLKNGLGSDLNSSPTVATNITLQDPTITDASQIADGIIGDSHFDRLTANAIQILNADIVNLQATKITAGTLAAGVILASNIAATQINAGTMSAVNVSGGTFSLISGGEQMLINGTNGFQQVNSGGTNSIQIFAGIIGASDTGSNRITMSSLSLAGANTGSGAQYFTLQKDVSGRGRLTLYDGASSSTEMISLRNDGTKGQVFINGTQVLREQQATVSSPAGGTTVDSEARTAIDAIISRLQTHGIIA